MAGINDKPSDCEAQDVQSFGCNVNHGWVKRGALLAALGCVFLIFGPMALEHWLPETSVSDAAASTVLGHSPGSKRSSHFPHRLQIAALVHLVHALAIVAAGVLNSIRPRMMLKAAMWCFLLGTILHCGSQYALIAVSSTVLELIAMAGGLLLVGGWLAFVEGACRGATR